MDTITMDQKEEIVMKLVHYFVTKCNYTPIVVNGVKNEVWLENLDGPYRIIRINSNYIHNIEQYNKDIFKIKSVVKQIKRKTLSFSINTLNIFLDINNNVNMIENKNIDSISLHKIADIKKNKIIVESFPDINNNILNDTKGIDLIINVTNDINKKTAEENRRYEKTFSHKKIVVTNILIVLCIIVFVASLFYPNILDMFANQRFLVKYGQFWRLITCMFFHAGIMHLLCNMYSLYILGSQVENLIGKWKFTFVYFVSGLVGSLLSITFSTNYSVGASGALFGLLGAYLYFGYHYRLYLSSVIKSQIIPIIAINLIISIGVPNIDLMAHVGGLIGGYLAMSAVGVENKSDKKEMINGWIVLSLLIIFLFGFVMFR